VEDEVHRRHFQNVEDEVHRRRFQNVEGEVHKQRSHSETSFGSPEALFDKLLEH